MGGRDVNEYFGPTRCPCSSEPGIRTGQGSADWWLLRGVRLQLLEAVGRRRPPRAVAWGPGVARPACARSATPPERRKGTAPCLSTARRWRRVRRPVGLPGPPHPRSERLARRAAAIPATMWSWLMCQCSSRTSISARVPTASPCAQLAASHQASCTGVNFPAARAWSSAVAAPGSAPGLHSSSNARPRIVRPSHSEQHAHRSRCSPSYYGRKGGALCPKGQSSAAGGDGSCRRWWSGEY